MSCEEQLTETVYSELLIGTAYETEADAEALILAVYTSLRGPESEWGAYYEYDYMMVSESGTDTYGIDAWNPGTQELEMGTWDNNYSFINNLWDGAYKVIAAANLAIEVLEGMTIDDGIKSSLVGEAKFLRGLAYYDLAFNFGDVILNTGQGEGDLPLSPQSEIIAQAIADFTDAASRLGGWPLPTNMATRDVPIWSMVFNAAALPFFNAGSISMSTPLGIITMRSCGTLYSSTNCWRLDSLIAVIHMLSRVARLSIFLAWRRMKFPMIDRGSTWSFRSASTFSEL